MKNILIIFTLLYANIIFAASTRSVQADFITPTINGTSVSIPKLQVDNVNIDGNTVTATSGELVLDSSTEVESNKDFVPATPSLNLGSSADPWNSIHTEGEHFGFRPENVTSLTMPISDPLKKGRFVWTTDTKKLWIDDGTAFVEAGGSGGISAWATAAIYSAGNIIHESNKIYKCLTGHTSGTFLTDLGSGKWVEISTGVTDHTLLSNIGTNTHAQIDTHIANVSNPHSVTKTQVGLSNVDNTSDAAKNAATATLTNKTLTSPVINSPTGIVKGDIGLGNVDNTSDATKNTAAATLTNKTLTAPVMTTPTLGDALATSVSIGGALPAGNSFAVASTTKSSKPCPVMTYSQMIALPTPQNGDCVNLSDIGTQAIYNSSKWNYGYGNMTIDTDWVPCTFSSLAWQGFGTVTNNSLQCRRVGSDLKMKGSFTTGVTAPSVAQIPLPSNYGNILTQTTGLDSYGRIHRNFSNSGELANLISTVGLSYMNVSAGIGYSTNQNTPVNGNAYANSSEAQTLENVSIPIAGWSSNSSTFSAASAGSTASLAYGTPAAYSANGIIIFPNEAYDTKNNYNPATGRFTLSEEGCYNVSALTVSNNSPYTIYVSKNGASVAPNALDIAFSPASTTNQVSGSKVVCGIPGDILDIRQSTSSSTVGPGSISFTKVSGPGFITANLITSPALVSTTSGTAIDFTGIPAGVRRITIMFSGVSTNSTSPFLIQLGTSGSIVATSYVSGMGYRSGETTSTSGFLGALNANSSSGTSGALTLNLSGESTGLWTVSGTSVRDLDGFANSSGGYKTLGTALDRIRLTTVGGTDIFDAGNVNISWER